LGEGLDPRIKELFLKRVDQLREQGFEIKEIDVPVLAYALSIYYTLMPAEVSTNLARFDGMKFGLQEESLGHDDIVSYYEKIRSA
jgi:aspartyl-tRNA(Asn)/glutamyl-tRNA(Gln) amidotransferase subunit A